MTVRFAALSALLLASAFPQPGHAQGPPLGQPYIQIPITGILKLPRFRGVMLDLGDYGSVVTASIAG
jgi:hypothetical protein